VLFPPCGIELTMTVLFKGNDLGTCDVLEWFGNQRTPNVRWNWVEMEGNAIFRRSIGRNIAALASIADWVWFCDADYWFTGKCWRAFDDVNLVESTLVFPKYVLLHKTHQLGDACVSRVDEFSTLVEAQPEEFSAVRMRRAIGGIQIVKGEFCRRMGYLRGSRRFQKVPTQAGFLDTPDDVAFRRSIGTQGQAVDLPEVYRIRHSAKGRHDHSVTL